MFLRDYAIRFTYNFWNNYEYTWIKCGLFKWRQLEYFNIYSAYGLFKLEY